MVGSSPSGEQGKDGMWDGSRGVDGTLRSPVTNVCAGEIGQGSNGILAEFIHGV